MRHECIQALWSSSAAYVVHEQELGVKSAALDIVSALHGCQRVQLRA